MRPGLLLPLCIVMSAIIHVVLLTAVAIPRQRTSSGQTMTVDLVTPDEVPNGAGNAPPDDTPAAPAATPAGQAETLQSPPPSAGASPPSPPQQQQQASNEPPPKREVRQSRQQAPTPQQQPQPQEQATQQTPPPEQPTVTPPPATPLAASQLPPDTLADQAERLSAMLNLPGPGTGDGSGATEALDKAKLTKDEVAAFRAHLKSCWKLPRGVAADERLKMVIRLSLRNNGALASDPTLIAGEPIRSESEALKLTALRDEAMRAIRQCAPYAMLPPEKYREWRILDIDFSPDQMSNG